MATGIIKWFNYSKGFGFIQPNDSSKDIFLHISALKASGIENVGENDEVSYETSAGKDNRVSAVNVRITKKVS